MEQKASLSEMVRFTSHIESVLIESNGEITDEVASLVDTMLSLKENTLPEKIDGCQFMLQRLETLAIEWDKKAQEIYLIAKGVKATKDRLKDYIKQTMIENKITDLHGNDWRFKLSNSKPKLLLDESTLDEKFKRVVTSVEPDKERIRSTLESGQEVKGAKLEESFSIRTYPNKKA